VKDEYSKILKISKMCPSLWSNQSDMAIKILTEE